MKDLKRYLITRLILLLIPVLILEQLTDLLLRHTLFAYLASQLGRGSGQAVNANPAMIAAFIRELIFGGNGQAAFNLISGSLWMLVFLLSVVLWVLPAAGGVLLYAALVERKMKGLEEAYEEEQRQHASRRNLMLSDFAHDLRTPIMTVAGYARALSDGMVAEEKKGEYLEAIRRKSDRLAELINLLFSYVKLDSEGFTLKRTEVDFHRLLTDEAAAAYTDLEEAGMRFEAEIPETPFMILADAPQLQRVIGNLLKNAARHNPPGTTAALFVRAIPTGEEMILADTGTVIEKTAEELFTPFVRGDDARSGDRGSGLGLSIAKKVADMHGYQLEMVQPFGSYTKAFVLRVFQDDQGLL